MSVYQDLIAKVQSNSHIDQTEALNQLKYLAVHDQQHFRKYVMRLLTLITDIMPNIGNENTILTCLHLLTDIINIYKPFVPKEQFNFATIVSYLSDAKSQIRKCSHSMILNFVKKYQQLDQILKSYDEIGREESCPWKLTQKILHSFESLMIYQPLCVKYSQNYKNVDRFLDFVFQKDQSQNSLIKKASNQALTSFVKNKYAPDIIPNLDKNITTKLINHSKSINYFQLPEKLQFLQNSISNKVNELKTKKQQQKNNFFAHEQNNQKAYNKFNSDKIVEQQIKINKTAENNCIVQHQQKLLSDKFTQVEFPKKKQSLNKEYQQFLPQFTTNKETELDRLIIKIKSNQPWNIKCEGITQIYQYLTNHQVFKFSQLLIERVLDLSSNIHFKIRLTSLKIILYVLSKAYKDWGNNLRIRQTILERISDSKSGIRKTALNIIKYLIVNQNEQTMLETIITKLYLNKSQIIEQILVCLQEISNLVPVNRQTIIKYLAKLLSYCGSSLPHIVKGIISICKQQNINTLYEILSEQQYQILQHCLQNKSKYLKTLQNPEDQVNIRLNKDFDSIQRIDIKRSTRRLVQLKSGNFKSHSLLNPQKMKMKEKINQTEIIQERANKNTNEKNTIQLNNNIRNIPKEFINSKTIKNPNYPKLESQKILAITNHKQRNKIPSISAQKIKIDLQDIDIFKRPRKQSNHLKPQKMVPINVQQFIPSTNEKQYDLPNYKAITYLKKQELQPLHRIDSVFKKMFINLKNDNNWIVQFQSINYLRRIIKHHKLECVELSQNLDYIIKQILHLVESPRSSLSKNAMISLLQMDPFVEQIFPKLFKKGIDTTNNFIIQVVKKCIDYLCQFCSSIKIIAIAYHAYHSRQFHIRLSITQIISNLILKHDQQLVLFLNQNRQISKIIGQYIIDSNEQVRSQTKSILTHLSFKLSKQECQDMFIDAGEISYTKINKIIQKESRRQ